MQKQSPGCCRRRRQRARSRRKTNRLQLPRLRLLTIRWLASCCEWRVELLLLLFVFSPRVLWIGALRSKGARPAERVASRVRRSSAGLGLLERGGFEERMSDG